jgi:hypothetical protein
VKFAKATYLAPAHLDGGFFLPGMGIAAQHDLAGHGNTINAVVVHQQEKILRIGC